MTQAHLARITPIVGTALQQKHVVVLGPADDLVRYLAASGICRWTFNRPHALLVAQIRAKHGQTLNWKFHTCSTADLPYITSDLIISRGSIGPINQVLDVPRLHIAGQGQNIQLNWAFRGEELTAPNNSAVLDEHTWPLIAGLARAILLRDTEFARPDLALLWQQGVRRLSFLPANPISPQWQTNDAPPPANTPLFLSPEPHHGRILIAGLGSLGSVAAHALAPHTDLLLLVDPDDVDVYNPVRQAFNQADIGRSKAEVLAETLSQHCQSIALPQALNDEADILALIEAHQLNAALIVTGTAADFELAYTFRQKNLPHVVGRCYPRARYWEGIVVDGQAGPSLDDLRGHLHLGPMPALTPEQRRAYSDAGVLEAEPATLIESGWAALWLARLLKQLISPVGLREAWFLQAMSAQENCFLGGTVVEETEQGPAYGIAWPGQIRHLGLADIKQNSAKQP